MKAPAKATLYIQYDAVNKAWTWEFRIPYKNARVSSEGLSHQTSTGAINSGPRIAKSIGVTIGEAYHNPNWDRKA